jgi:hypothetical protein
MTDKLPRSTRNERMTRLLDAGDVVNGEEPGPVLYAHTVFCQTGLPYRNPGDAREWERANGVARLKVLAGEAMHPQSGEFVQIGLPFGPKPRLILAHLNGEALRQQSPEIEIDHSLTAFVKRLHLDPGGRTIGSVPLHEHALSALSGNAMGLDVYAWLSQRLHRVDPTKPVLVPWPALQAQFGWHYTRLRKFREVFTATLRDVHSQYRGADIDLDGRGMTLRHSPTPVKSRWWPVSRLP